MDFLKKFFPYSFGTKEVSNLVVKIIIYVVAVIIGGALLALIGAVNGFINLPLVSGLVGALLGLIGGLIELYCLAGIVVLLLDYFKVLK